VEIISEEESKTDDDITPKGVEEISQLDQIVDLKGIE